MKRIYLFILVVLLQYSSAYGQECRCDNEFMFVKHYIENNYAGFKDKVSDTTRPAYLELTEYLLERSRHTTKESYCWVLINEWLGFFEDGHIQVRSNFVSAGVDSVRLSEMIAETEIIELPVSTIESLYGSDTVEGIYFNRDSTYKVAVVKNENEFRDYAGIIVSSKSELWSEGQVKFELKSVDENRFTAIVYYLYHQPYIETFTFDGVSFNEGGWTKAGRELFPRTNDRNPNVSSEILPGDIFYLQIGTFEEWNARNIDSVMTHHRDFLTSAPSWIIDLRGNGGGSDFSFRPLIPYLYTGPISVIGTDVLATEENIKNWSVLLDNPHIPEDVMPLLRKIMEKMAAHKGEFVSIVDDTTITFDEVKMYPERVVVLVDENCASSTENFILGAMQSEKVTVMGQPTAGVLDYANMRSADFPCYSLRLEYATTRSRRIDMGKGIDNKGIAPDIVLDPGKDWKQEAILFLEQN
jgi:hypothetical protein